MFNWLQFSLLDMTPYDRQTWFRLVESYNEAYGIFPLASLLLAALLLWLLLRPIKHAPRFALILLAACWGWCGWVFQMQYHASLNWAGAYFGWLFVIQTGLLLLAAVFSKTLAWREFTSWQAKLGLLVLSLGLLLQPLSGLLESRTIEQLEWFGLIPAPTTLATLGILMLLNHWIRIGLLIIPIVWSLISAAFAWKLGLLEVWFTSFALLALILHWLPRRSA